MTTFTELEQRLEAALDRIEGATARVPDAGARRAEAEELETLRAKLEEERTANAQLVERIKALKERQETEVAELQAALSDAENSNAEKTAVQQELKARIEELRGQIARLTEANRAMVGDADLVNTAMMAELDAMRASRRADVTEIDDILARIQPRIEGGANA